MRKYLALLAALLILFIPSVYAAGADRIQDMAGLLDESQEQMLRGQIEELARKYQFDAVIVTVDSLEAKLRRNMRTIILIITDTATERIMTAYSCLSAWNTGTGLFPHRAVGRGFLQITAWIISAVKWCLI